MQNRIQDGVMLNYAAKTGEVISGGDLVEFEACVGVAATDIFTGETGAVAVEGVFDLPKASGAVAQGDALFLDSSGKLTKTSGDTYVGVAWEAAAASAETVPCRINFGNPPVVATPVTPPAGN